MTARRASNRTVRKAARRKLMKNLTADTRGGYKARKK